MAGALRAKVILEAYDRASAVVGKVEGRFRRFAGVLKTSVVGAIGVVTVAMAGLSAVLVKGVAAAQVQEDASNKLRTALRGLGPAAEESAKGLEAQAAAMEQTTRFADESVIATQALLAEMGVAPAKLAAATAATVDLAAAFGFSLEQAARNVGKTIGGTAGELGELIPELRAMSAEALRAGEGIAFLGDRFRGAAERDAATFAGSLVKLRNAFGTLLEVLGDSIVKNDAVREAMQRLTATISDPKFLASLKLIIDRVVRMTTELVEFADKVRRKVGPAVEVLAKGFKLVGDNLAQWFTPAIVEATAGAELLTTASEQAGRAIGVVDDSVRKAASGITTYSAANAAAAVATADHAVGAEAAAEATGDLAEAAVAAIPALGGEVVALERLAAAAGFASAAMVELNAASGIGGGVGSTGPTRTSLPSFEEILALSQNTAAGVSLGGLGLDLISQRAPRIEGLGLFGAGFNVDATLASLDRLRVNRERRL